jgi:hypothetical protein
MPRMFIESKGGGRIQKRKKEGEKKKCVDY